MQCPKCGNEMLDVRAQKSNPKAPDFQCPDASCLNDKGYRTGAWLPKGKTPAPIVPPSVPQAQSGASREVELGNLYWRCFNEVLTVLKQEKLVDMFHGDAIAAMTATLFIQRAKG